MKDVKSFECRQIRQITWKKRSQWCFKWMQIRNKMNQNWILDSGVSRHMTTIKRLLINYQEFEASESQKENDA